jgi:hypothetical protein
VDFADAWISLADPLDSTDTIVGSTSYFDPIGTADRWLITPQINLGAYGNYLYWDGRSDDPSFPDGYFVLVSRTDTQISSFTDTVAIVNAELATWNADTVNLSAFGLDGEQIHIAFVNRTFDGFKLYLDSISVFVDDPVGLEENTPLAVSVFPNPTRDRVKLSVLANTVNVYGLSGAAVARFEDTDVVSLEGLESGIYYLEIVQGNSRARKKIVKH